MLFQPGLPKFGYSPDNWGASPSSTPGTSVTPGASNAEGSWTQLQTALTYDIQHFTLMVHGGATAGASKPQVLDIGVDPAGGTSYTSIIDDLVIGGSPNLLTTGSGDRYAFPIFIKAGSTVAARIQGANATAGTVRVAIKFYGQPSAPELWPTGSYSETIGAVSSSNAVSFTPGNAADGSWVSLGTTTKGGWWINMGVQIDNTTVSAHYTYVEVAVGDATNKVIVLRNLYGTTTNESIGDIMGNHLNPTMCYYEIPPGSELWIRGRNNTTPVTGYNGNVVLVGG